MSDAKSGPETLANGAVVAQEPAFKKWIVLDSEGSLIGMRYTRERALALAASVPPGPAPPPAPREIPRSQRAKPPPADKLAHPVQLPDEGPMPVRRPDVVFAYESGKRLTRGPR